MSRKCQEMLVSDAWGTSCSCGPSFPLLQCSSFPGHPSEWEKVGDDAGRKAGDQPGEEGFRGHAQESGISTAGRCRAVAGF